MMREAQIKRIYEPRDTGKKIDDKSELRKIMNKHHDLFKALATYDKPDPEPTDKKLAMG